MPIAVITQTGDGVGVDGSGHALGSVYQFSGAKIGFNIVDRFMVAMGTTLMVITQTGDVFGAHFDSIKQTIGPVFQFSGAKIGFNIVDRFMVAMGDTLMVITQTGEMSSEDITDRKSTRLNSSHT